MRRARRPRRSGAGSFELGEPARDLAAGRIRRPGGCRKRTVEHDLTLRRGLEALIEPGTPGDPESPVRWTTKSVRRLAAELERSGHRVSYRIVADLLHELGYRLRLWKLELQKLADETGLEIAVCHFPPGISKGNRIEHHLFSAISQNWRGKPLVSHEVIVKLIAATTTRTGPRARSALDENRYPAGRTVSDADMATLHLRPDAFHGEWNYSLLPATR